MLSLPLGLQVAVRARDNGTHQLLGTHPGTDWQDVLSTLCRTSNGEMGAWRPRSAWWCCLSVGPSLLLCVTLDALTFG